ncbi:hypothetical protein CUJ84_Chr002320 [Rhizobium leguminosarum]|uniref:GNAT family N-acetyltransferase n=1 Tax=Rhizobium leguminosarum TaxID=384 RepID=A0A2K9Z381_RHILE|nr:hypothetical protein CUJ84_Chr002320 [Rhizobium leguminosarum]
MWGDPVRGRGLGLWLMREAQHVLGNPAFSSFSRPTRTATKVPHTALLKLAAYQSDKQLGFKAVSKRKRPGWLVGSWEEPLVHGGDSTFYYLD